jgi:aldose 1-epimerase
MNTLFATIRRATMGDFATIAVEGPTLRAEIALRGGTLLSWSVLRHGRWVSLIDGYRDADELLAQNGVRMGVMAPFVNRIADARYVFDGVEHDLRPGSDNRLVYHGLVRELDFRLGEASADDDHVHVVFALDAADLEAQPGYPFLVDVRIAYRFTRDGLALTVSGVNRGEITAPFAAGWHPYFTLESPTIDVLEIDVPSRRRVLTDALLIPVNGDPIVGIDDDTDLTGGRPVGSRALDMCYVDLEQDADGIARTRLRNPTTGQVLTIWQSGGAMHVFTAHTLRRGPRGSIALEPVQTQTNAFNRADLASSIALAPGGEREFRFGVVLSDEVNA